MTKHPKTQMEPLEQMSAQYRKIRSNQPSRSSLEMRAQLERNRLDYAKKQQSFSAEQSSTGLKKVG
jgi:hypothetical protein